MFMNVTTNPTQDARQRNDMITMKTIVKSHSLHEIVDGAITLADRIVQTAQEGLSGGSSSRSAEHVKLVAAYTELAEMQEDERMTRRAAADAIAMMHNMECAISE